MIIIFRGEDRRGGAYVVVGGEGMPLGADQANGEQVAWWEKRKHVQPRINWQLLPHSSTPLFLLHCTRSLM